MAYPADEGRGPNYGAAKAFRHLAHRHCDVGGGCHSGGVTNTRASVGTGSDKAGARRTIGGDVRS